MNTQNLLPRAIQPGDAVGIFSPSSPITAEAVETMTRYFNCRGLRVKVASNTLAAAGFMAGTPHQRAGDLNGWLHDPDVRMVMTSMGGAGAVHLLPLIDYDAFAADPKIVVGLSDPSILLLALTALTGVPTFHGPNGVEFGGLCPLTPFCEENFWRMVSGLLPVPYALPVEDNFVVLRSGPPVEGRLLGGNLPTIEPLLGTPYEPDWDGAILFVEEFQADPVRRDQVLAHFRLSGVLDRINGLILGKPEQVEPGLDESLDEIVLRNCAGYSFPIASGLLIGHTDDKLTLPVGCRACLDPSARNLILLDPAVRVPGL